MINKSIPLNTHYWHQLLVGLLLSIWLYAFLAFVGPFDAAEVALRIRVFLMLGYGLVFFLSYALLIPLQNWIYQKSGKWTVGYEVLLLLFFTLYSLPACFAYYKTKAVNGTFSFSEFSLTVFMPTILILLPVIFVGRYLVARYGISEPVEKPAAEPIILSGSNKLDVLKLPWEDLVAMEAANNYVNVYYLREGQLQKKLLRSSLRKMHEMAPDLVQVHRSYLVNPQHFVEWKDGQTLVLTQLTVPVSQKHKATLLEMPAFAPQ